MKRSDLNEEFEKYKGNVEYTDGQLACIVEHKGMRFNVQFLPSKCKDSLLIKNLGMSEHFKFKHRQTFQRAFEYTQYDTIEAAVDYFYEDILTCVNESKERKLDFYDVPSQKWDEKTGTYSPSTYRDFKELNPHSIILKGKYFKPGTNKAKVNHSYMGGGCVGDGNCTGHPLAETFTHHNGKAPITVEDLWGDYDDEPKLEFNKSKADVMKELEGEALVQFLKRTIDDSDYKVYSDTDVKRLGSFVKELKEEKKELKLRVRLIKSILKRIKKEKK